MSIFCLYFIILKYILQRSFCFDDKISEIKVSNSTYGYILLCIFKPNNNKWEELACPP